MTELAELRVRRPRRAGSPSRWSTGLALIVAWALDDPAWVNGRGALTDCLRTFALGGVAIGFAGRSSAGAAGRPTSWAPCSPPC